MENKKPKAMIMSAGMGSRLEPLTLQVPKPLVRVCNRPVMDILFEHLSSIGINDVICNTYYLSEQIISRYEKNNFGINFNYITEKELSGTAGGLRKCRFFFDDDFVVLSADGLTNADILKGFEAHKKSNAIATIVIKEVNHEEVSHYGVVVTDKNGFVTEFQEKPSIDEAKSNCINTGIYFFKPQIFDYIPANTFYDFAKNVFPKLLTKINTFKINDYWSDIGTIEQYKQSMHDVFDGKCVFPHENIIKTPSGRYISSSKIPFDTVFKGNSSIGMNCKIGSNVVIENSILWDDVTVSDNVHLKNCIIASGKTVTASLSDKVIGSNTDTKNFLSI